METFEVRPSVPSLTQELSNKEGVLKGINREGGRGGKKGRWPGLRGEEERKFVHEAAPFHFL